MHGSAQQGFTLVELMVTLAVLAIVVTFAVPDLRALVNGNRLTASGNELLAALQTARVEAVRRNRRTVVCLSADPSAVAPSCSTGGADGARGWLLFVDGNRNGVYDDGAPALLRSAAAGRGVSLRASPSIPGQLRVSYRADGYARDAGGTALLAGAIELCMPTELPTENVRRLVIGPGGRVTVDRRAGGGACAAPLDPA